MKKLSVSQKLNILFIISMIPFASLIITAVVLLLIMGKETIIFFQDYIMDNIILSSIFSLLWIFGYFNLSSENKNFKFNIVNY